MPIVQPEKIRNNPEFRARLEAIRPDAIIVVAYGRIIPEWMLSLPRWGNLNLHASLLPKYRGAAPIQWAVANGESVTGATTMRLDQGLDTGDILLQREIAIGPDQTAEQLFPLLAESGASLMIETLDGLQAGRITPIAQDDAASSLAPILQREDALVDFARSAGRDLQPLAWLSALAGSLRFLPRQKAYPASPDHRRGRSAVPPGELVVERDRLFVGAGSATRLELLEVQLEGKKKMPVADFLRGTAPHPHEKLAAKV